MSELLTVVLATSNVGKVAELRALLADLPIQWIGVGDVLGDKLSVNEDGLTFEANATIKARAVSAATRLVALADDSGLEVDALGGRPGSALPASRVSARRTPRTTRRSCVSSKTWRSGRVRRVSVACSRWSIRFGTAPCTWPRGAATATSRALRVGRRVRLRSAVRRARARSPSHGRAQRGGEELDQPSGSRRASAQADPGPAPERAPRRSRTDLGLAPSVRSPTSRRRRRNGRRVAA